MIDDASAPSDVQRERAEYIERMVQELSRIASTSGMPMLAYLLDMAGEEAAQMRAGGRFQAVPVKAAAGRVPRRSAD